MADGAADPDAASQKTGRGFYTLRHTSITSDLMVGKLIWIKVPEFGDSGCLTEKLISVWLV